MPPLRELNPSSLTTQNERPKSEHIETMGVALHDRLLELEIQNMNLQKLVVELLNKNERLRASLAQQEKDTHA